MVPSRLLEGGDHWQRLFIHYSILTHPLQSVPLLAAYPLFIHGHLLRVVHKEERAGIDTTLIGSNVFTIAVIAYHITILLVADRLGTISIGVFLAGRDEHATSDRINADSAGRIDLCTIDELRLLIRL